MLHLDTSIIIKLLKENSDMSVMIDFYKSTKLNSTTDTIREYVTKSTRRAEFCISEMNGVSSTMRKILPILILGRIRFSASLQSAYFNDEIKSK